MYPLNNVLIILRSNFQNMIRLNEKEYCDNLIVLTSDIIQKYFTDLEIPFLAQRVKNGVEENIMDNKKTIFVTKKDMEKFDINTPLRKKRICIGIARFYIKVAHVFSAIVMTMNPVYTYKDEAGNVVQKNFYEKTTIPQNAMDRKVSRKGICNRRIKSLQKGNELPENQENMVIGPDVCFINTRKDGHTMTLEDEPGMIEWMELYNDKYDYQTGQFVGMTEQTAAIYKSDLETFYKAFTGEEKMPETITTFSDIKLRSYHKSEKCNGKNAPWKRKYTKTSGDDKETGKLFSLYADNLKQMMIFVQKSQDALLERINDLFVYVVDEQTKEKTTRINPELTESGLDKVIASTRKTIMEMYINCEKHYAYGFELYQAIAEKKMFDTNINQMDNLQEQEEALLYEEKEKEKEKPVIPYEYTKPMAPAEAYNYRNMDDILQDINPYQSRKPDYDNMNVYARKYDDINRYVPKEEEVEPDQYGIQKYQKDEAELMQAGFPAELTNYKPDRNMVVDDYLKSRNAYRDAYR